MKPDDVRIRKVRVLGDRARETANKMGLNENDLVIVTTYIEKGKLPKYELEKIEGSPITYLHNELRNEIKEINKKIKRDFWIFVTWTCAMILIYSFLFSINQCKNQEGFIVCFVFYTFLLLLHGALIQRYINTMNDMEKKIRIEPETETFK